jgi:hypothetical protein
MVGKIEQVNMLVSDEVMSARSSLLLVQVYVQFCVDLELWHLNHDNIFEVFLNP